MLEIASYKKGWGTLKQQSGIDALLEALRASGIDVGSGFGGGSPFDAEPVSSSGERSTSDGASRGKGPGIPNKGTSFSEAIGEWGRKAFIVTAIIVVIAALVAYWWFHPPINVHSVDTWLFVAVFILLPLFVFFKSRSAAYSKGTKKVSVNEGKAKGFKIASWIPLAIVLVGVVGGLASLAVFPGNAAKYANVLQVQDSTFTEDIQEVNYAEIPVIDRESAIRLGSNQLGSIPEYVSQFEISTLYSQINYHQEPVRVSPLGYADLFKWFTNRSNGIPAYSLVNMTSQDAQIVQLPEGQGIKYSQSEPLARNIDRYVQLKYPFYMFDQKSFEIDEDGNPWWICPVQTRTIGLFGGTTIDRVVLCNAVTGECQDLAIEDCPQWVDQAYPANLLIEQYNWHGAYSNGWLNSFLGQQGVVQTTPGTDGQLGYNYIAKDDDVWVYTGVTSATADTSIVGFVLVNQRTAEAHFYSVSGATEDRAMRSAEGAVQDLGYSSTFPLLINVSGRPTYFMSLKDGEGTVKQYAMVDIQSYQNVATGTTVAECQKAYQALLSANGIASSSQGDVAGQSVTGVIERTAQAVIEGNSHFYVMLEGDERIFDCALPSLLQIVGYGEGDEVTFEFLEGDGVCTVTAIKESGEADSAKAEEAAGDPPAEASQGQGQDVPEQTSETPGGQAPVEDGQATTGSEENV